MGIVRAFTGALSSSLADQWKDIITAGIFDEHTLVTPGILKNINNGRGSNLFGSDGVVTNGSRIYVPENTAAFIFSQAGIEEVITEAGGYEYNKGEESIFSGGGVDAVIDQVKDRFKYGGITATQKQIAFVNLKEIRNLKFGTRGPQMYNDLYYGTDLDIMARGSFSLKVVDAALCVKNFIPANVMYYSFDDQGAKEQILTEFLQSFTDALNTLSSKFRISQLPSQATELSQSVISDSSNAGTWPERFGLKIVSVAVESIEFTEESKKLVQKYSENKMSLSAYEDISQKASNISAQQKIAQGIQDNGFGDGAGGMILGMNMADALGTNANAVNTVPHAETPPESAQPEAQQKAKMSFDEQIEAVKKLKELLDNEIITQEEFDMKKKEIMDL